MRKAGVRVRGATCQSTATLPMSRTADELLYDTEAALRLVDTALLELQGSASETFRPPLSRFDGAVDADGGSVLREKLSGASVDVAALLDALRACRAILEAHPQLLAVPPAAFHDDLHVAHGAHVGERISTDGDDVGEEADA